MPLVIFDLDGTLADNSHRQHILDDAKVRNADVWNQFFDACDKDELIKDVAMLNRVLWASGWDVYIWSGRSARVREQTVRWLRENGVYYHDLRMRDEDNRIPDEVLKGAWLDELLNAGERPAVVFDDRDKVVRMWRAENITCCQVAEGSF